MSPVFQTLETTLARGADGLTAEARAKLVVALLGLRGSDGGFAGLDRRSDPYYTLFAWLCLRGLDAVYDRSALCAYLSACPRHAGTVDASCADFVLSVESGVRMRCLPHVLSAMHRGDAYAFFLASLITGKLPSWLVRTAMRWMFRSGVGSDLSRLPTPRLAAGAVLASLAGTDTSAFVSELRNRRLSSGGYASAAGTAPDLLATAAARFACDWASAALPAHECSGDLAFVESCWMEDGLFGPSPSAACGDAEHTFYGLLALGTCR